MKPSIHTHKINKHNKFKAHQQQLKHKKTRNSKKTQTQSHHYHIGKQKNNNTCKQISIAQQHQTRNHQTKNINTLQTTHRNKQQHISQHTTITTRKRSTHTE